MAKILLQKIKLENFKCDKNAVINFKSLSSIVGENNAGKSCLIEALRLVSKAAKASKKRIYTTPPNSFELPLSTRGFVIDTHKLIIDLSVVIYYYDSADYAKITAYFVDKSKIEIYLNKETAFAVLYDSENKIIKTKKEAEKLQFDKIGILPQIGPIRENEKLISEATISGDKDTYLSSLHFRNEIYAWKDKYFNEFKQNAEETWAGLQIISLDYTPFQDDFISLMVEDNYFPAEIGKMGNGLQMWLQIIWFLSRSKNCDLIILDEPDVYMHSDMQRRILELVKSKFPQVIIATHSLEIISRVDPECILEINKKDKTMKYANDSTSVQKIIDAIGGVQNLSLINLGRQRRCLFVEGKDLSYLNKFSECLYGKQLEIPTFSLGGFNNIPQVYGVASLFFNETADQIKCYALADRDFRDFEVVNKLYCYAKEKHLYLHVWERKEIENYLIIPEIIYQYVPSKFKLCYADFLQILDNLLEEQKNTVFDSFSEQYRKDSKNSEKPGQWDIAKCNSTTRQFFSKYWNTLEDKIKLVSGKNFLSIVFEYFQTNFGVTLSNKKIICKLTPDKIPDEVKEFLKQLI